MKIILFICITLFLNVYAIQPLNIVGITYNRSDNNSIVVLDATSQKIIKSRLVGNFVFHVSASAINIKERSLILIEDKILMKYDVETLQQIGYTNLQISGFETKFDEIAQKLYGLEMKNGCWLVEIDHVTGYRERLIEFPIHYGVYLGGTAIDSRNHRYWMTASDHYQNRKYLLVQFDLIRKNITREIEIEGLVNGMHYDYKYDRLIGVYNTQVVALDYKSGKIIPLVSPNAGLPGLYDGMFDSDNQIYFYGANKLGNNSRVMVNVQTKQLKIFPTFDTLKHTYLIPRK